MLWKGILVSITREIQKETEEILSKEEILQKKKPGGESGLSREDQIWDEPTSKKWWMKKDFYLSKINCRTFMKNYNNFYTTKYNKVSMDTKNIWMASAYNEESMEADLEKISSVSSCFGCASTCSSR